MRKETLIRYCWDLGKFLIDAAKILFGSVVVAPIVKNEFQDIGWTPVIGIVASLVSLTAGIILTNFKK